MSEILVKLVLLTQRQRRRDFGRNNVPGGRTIQQLVAKFRKTGSVADAEKGQDSWSFGIIPDNIQNLRESHEEFPRKSTRRLLQETGISRTLVLRILHDDLELFPYKIQICQRQADQNKAERETFCKDVSQRTENDPRWLDLNDLNDVHHCGPCGASAPRNIEFSFYQVHCPCQNLSRIAAVSEELILWQSHLNNFYQLLRSKSFSWIYIGVKRTSQACCLHHLKNMEKNCKTQLWNEKAK